MMLSSRKESASGKEIKVHYFKGRLSSDSSTSAFPSFTYSHNTHDASASFGQKNRLDKYQVSHPTVNVQSSIISPFALLQTREIAWYRGHETYLKTSLVELLIYLCFLLIISTSVIEKHSSDINMFTTSMVNKFTKRAFGPEESLETLNFKDINTIEYIWDYLNLLVIIFGENNLLNSISSHTGTMKKDNKTTFRDNDLIGLPRIRSIRVKNDSCKIVKEIENNLICYSYFSTGQEDTESFGLRVGTAWSYTSAEGTKLPIVEGTVSFYGGGGFYQDCPKSADKFYDVLRALREGKWIDRATRAVITDFTIYNVNLDVFSFIKLLFEIPSTGGVIPSFMIQTLKFSDHSEEDIIYSARLILFSLFIVFFTVQELVELVFFRCEYFKSLWNFLDVFILMMSYSVIIDQMFRLSTSLKVLEEIVSNDNKFANFNDLLELHTSYHSTLSLLIFFCWVKLLKYLSINDSVFKLQAAILQAISDIIWYSILFIFVLFIFAFMGHILFGNQVECYHTFSSSIRTILQAGLGRFDYHIIQQVSPYLGPTFFLLFIYFVCFLLVAVYIAILVYAYEEVRHRVNEITLQMKVRDVIENIFVNLIKKFSHKSAVRIRDSFNTRKIQTEFQDLRCLLKSYGFVEIEINMFLKKYEISVDRVMTNEDLIQIRRKVTKHGQTRIELVREMVRQNAAEKLSILEEIF